MLVAYPLPDKGHRYTIRRGSGLFISCQAFGDASLGINKNIIPRFFYVQPPTSPAREWRRQFPHIMKHTLLLITLILAILRPQLCHADFHAELSPHRRGINYFSFYVVDYEPDIFTVKFHGQEITPSDWLFTIEDLTPKEDVITITCNGETKEVDLPPYNGNGFAFLDLLDDEGKGYKTYEGQMDFSIPIDESVIRHPEKYEYGVIAERGLKQREAKAGCTKQGDFYVYDISVDRLFPESYYDISYYVIIDGEKYSYRFRSIRTKPNTISLRYTSTQTTATITDVTYSSDNTFSPTKACIVKDDGTLVDVIGKITGFTPIGVDYNYPFINIRTYIGDEYEDYSYEIKIDRPAFDDNKTTTSTGILVSPYFKSDEIKVIRFELDFFERNSNKVESTFTIEPGNTLYLGGLRPNSEYKYNLRAILSIPGRNEEYRHDLLLYDFFKDKYFKDVLVTTTELQLTTVGTRNVSPTQSIVSATTNINDRETSVGFQWKKYDAPSTLPPSEGYAAIYDGSMEGRINNLQPTSYYNFRPFYKSNDGTYYYGQWQTFDPSDFSYFEPTVHTYDVEGVNASGARVRGYVMAGTDDVDEQGFEYSSTSSAQQHRIVCAATSPSVVLATGQIMNATLEGLEPATTYIVRAFATTASGTVYGEEQTFTTDAAATGITDAIAGSPRPTIVCYYSISGQKTLRPQQGFNIVLYSDGTTEKVFIR